MTPRRLLLVLVLLLVPAAPAAAMPLAAAKVVSCDPDARTVRFEASMRGIPGAERLQMRFTLQVDEDGWERVAAPTFDTWSSSAPGKAGYVYSKEVQNLTPGAYRVLVRFRWRGADGAVVRTARRRSRGCVVPDERANLIPVRVRVGAGPTADTRAYRVVVANRGRSDAGPFSVSLSVDGVPLPDRAVDGLPARKRTAVVFVGPPCDPADGLVVAGVDPDGLVEEAEEADDMLTVDCQDLA